MSYHTHFLTPSHIYNLVLETKTNLVKYFCLCPHLMYKHKCRNKIFSTKHSWKERISGMEGSINILRVSKWLSFHGWHQIEKYFSKCTQFHDNDTTRVGPFCDVVRVVSVF